jgi:hypothetical protein
MPLSMRLAIPGILIALVGAVIALALWHIGGIVILMIGAVLLLAAKFRRGEELSEQRRSVRRSI